MILLSALHEVFKPVCSCFYAVFIINQADDNDAILSLLGEETYKKVQKRVIEVRNNADTIDVIKVMYVVGTFILFYYV